MGSLLFIIMGEYAEMYIDSSFNDYYDRITNSGRYDSLNDQSLIDDWDFDDMEMPDFSPMLKTKRCFEISEIIKQTEKSVLVKMKNTQRKFWVSKKFSTIKSSFIFIDSWYAKKLIPVF